MHLAIDMMSGDFGLRSSISAVLKALEAYSFLHLHLVGPKAQVQTALVEMGDFQYPTDRVHFHDTPIVLPMSASVQDALRAKGQSSLAYSIELVANKTCSGVVSSGSTPAMLVLGRQILGCFDTIDRPVICAQIPKASGVTYLLDVGANTSMTAVQLASTALMGAALANVMMANETKPRVALLNIGTEENKGPSVIRSASDMLKNRNDIHYIGFAEGNKLFHPDVDVLACEGFVGNVMLKTAEGVVSNTGQRLNALLAGSGFKLWGGLTSKLQEAVKTWFNPKRYNGASLLGLKGVVVKSHGSADTEAFYSAIEVCISEVDADLPAQVCNMMMTSETNK